LGQNVGLLDWRPGPGKVGHKNAKTPPLMMCPPENPKPKTKKFFINLNQMTCWIRRWFEQLSSSIGWRVTALQTCAKILAGAGLKGL